MEEITYVEGEASRQTLMKVHHTFNLVAPIIPEHLIPAMRGEEGAYKQFANFPWDPMVCYMLEFPGERHAPAVYIEHGMTTDFFGTGSRSNGYNSMGGVVACSGGIFISQQDTLSSFGYDEDGLEPKSYNQSMEAFNMYLAPLMNRPFVEPSVAIIYSEYRNDFLLFSSVKELWGAGPQIQEGGPQWILPDGWGLVGTSAEDGYIGWLNVINHPIYPEEIRAAARYLLHAKGQLNIPPF